MKEIEPGTIEWEQKCWKYFDIDKFVASLENGYMYFAAATQFEDNFEGSVQIMRNSEIELFSKVPHVMRVNKAFKELQRLTKISCWHKADFESDLMWKAYAQDKKGVAITTSPSKMKVAFQPYRIKPEYGVEELYIGNVVYDDLITARAEDCLLGRFYHKDKAFESENELRLSIPLRMAEEYGVKVPKKGIRVTVDYSVLIDDIIIGPNTCSSDSEKVIAVLERLNLTSKLKESRLAYAPLFI